MKKNFVLAALVAVAAIFAGCEKKEPTAVLPEDMNAKVIINGYVRSQAYEEKSSVLVPKEKKEPVANATIKVLYGVKVKGVMTYKEYSATTNKEGFYQIELGCATGKTIDEVKVQAGAFVKDGTKAYKQNSDGSVDITTTDAYFYGEKSQLNAAAGNAYKLNVDILPVDLTSYPDMSLL